MGRKSNDVENRKRKTKKDKARRKKELYGKYRPTREGDTLASSKPKKNFSKSSQNQKKTKKNFSKSSQNPKKTKNNFSKSSQKKKSKK